MLHVLGLVHDLVEAAEVLGVQDAGELAALLGWSEIAFLPHLLGDVPPALVVQPSPAARCGRSAPRLPISHFRFELRKWRRFRPFSALLTGKSPLEFRGPAIMRNHFFLLCRCRNSLRTTSPWSSPAWPFGKRATMASWTAWAVVVRPKPFKATSRSASAEVLA